MTRPAPPFRSMSISRRYRPIASRLLLAVVLLIISTSRIVFAAETPSVTIAWDPPEEDSTVTGYVVLVGTEAGTYAQQFDVGNSTMFDYVSGDTGRRYFFVVKSYNGASALSEPSSEVSAVVGESTGGSTSPPRQRWPAPGQPSSDAITPPAGSSAAVPRSKLVAALTNAGDEGVLLIEGGRVIRTLVDGVVGRQPLLVADSGIELTGVAADRAFGQTRLLFVGEAAMSPDGMRELTIARYRDVNHTLGERAVIVTGLPLPAVGDPLFDVDGAGHLYVALPGPVGGGTSRGDPYAARILRFNLDGTVPRDNQAGSPIVAYSYGRPTALEVDLAGRIWLAGSGAPWSQPLAVLQPTVTTTQWPAVPQGVAVPAVITSGGVTAMAVVSGQTLDDPARLVLLSGDRLAALQFTAKGVSAPVSWRLADHGTGTALLATGSNTVFVTFASTSGDTRVNDEAAIARFQLP